MVPVALTRQTASSASLTCNASRSASEKTATVFRPIFLAVLITRQAISPRFATNNLENDKPLAGSGVEGSTGGGSDDTPRLSLGPESSLPERSCTGSG